MEIQIYCLISLLSCIFVQSAPQYACPSSCYCDDNAEYVSCVGDGLWELPSEIPNTTVRLELRNYMVHTLLSNSFDGLDDLEELKLQQSRIEVLDNDTFHQSNNLEKLDLSQNNLTFLNSAVLRGLIKLRFLDLSSNSLQYIDEAFADLAKLEQLNLRDNKIPQLSTHTFIGLHKVQYMNLDANNISYIEVGTFQYLTNLAHLIISNNPLNTLSRLDFFGSRLQFIDISHVGLDRVPQSLTKFVRDLRLAKNNLTKISSGDFDSYPYLGLLVLDDNCVSDIENDALGRQEYLMRLWLNGNCLSKIPPNLPPSLLALYMEENKLTEIHSYSFKGLIHMEQLFLQRNKIRLLETCAFCDLVSLKSLDLQANEIENLTNGVFANLSQLQTLDLSQNNLKTIDAKCFDGLGRLKTLQMSRVPTFVQLDEAMFDPLQSLQNLEVYDSTLLVHTILSSTRMMHGLRKVQKLNIMHNRIVRLRSDFPSFLPDLKVIKMSGNLWHCDKNIAWLANWIKQSNVQFYSSYSIRCASPHDLHYKPLMMLTDNDFLESTETEVASTQLVTTEPFTSSSTASVSETFSSALFISPVDNVNLSQTSTLAVYSTEISVAKFDGTTQDNVDKSEQSTTATELEIKSTTQDTESTTQQKFISADPYRYHILPKAGIEKKTTEMFATSFSSIFSDKTEMETTSASSTELSSQAPTTPYIAKKTTRVTEKSAETKVLSRYDNNSIISERTVLSSRLRGWTDEDTTTDPPPWNSTTTVIVSAIVAVGGLLLLVGGLVTLLTLVRCRHRYQPVKHKNLRRSSSISYYPQKDEVSIVTLTEGTVGLRTNSYHGLGNKLYYIMENSNGNSADLTRDAIPDSQLQELLPRSSGDNAQVY